METHGDRLVKVVLPNPVHIEQELVAIRIDWQFIDCDGIRMMSNLVKSCQILIFGAVFQNNFIRALEVR